MFKSISLIPGYEEFTEYEIDINGNLRRGDRILKWTLNTCGYPVCTLSMNGKQKIIKQHRAIALLFISNPRACEFVDHKNGITTDNRIENLRWCTYTENNQNSKIRCDNSSGHKHIAKICKRTYWYWIIVIKANSKRSSKCFRCEPDAIEPPADVLVYRDQMVQELHGEFARIIS
jgi:hypothetical protein